MLKQEEIKAHPSIPFFMRNGTVNDREKSDDRDEEEEGVVEHVAEHIGFVIEGAIGGHQVGENKEHDRKGTQRLIRLWSSPSVFMTR